MHGFLIKYFVLGRFDLYKVDLKSMKQDVQEISYLLDNQFFANIESEDIQKGKVNILLTVTKTLDVFNLTFKINGTVTIPCDRCLDDMDYPIETTARLIVKFGKDYAEESDEIVIIPESEGVINLAWFLYEFIALAIPIKHIHAPGKCNKQMTSKLKKHTAKAEDDADDFDDVELGDDDSEADIDPRWDALRELKEKE